MSDTQPTKDTDKGRSMRLLLRCLSYFKPYSVQVVIGFIGMAVVAACTAGAAYLVKPALDDIFFRKNVDALFWIPFLYVVLIVVKGAFQFLQQYMMKWSGFKVLEDLRNELYGKIIRLPMPFFEENQIGVLMSRIITDVSMIRISMPAVIMFIRQVLTMIGLIFVVFWQDWFLAIWAVLVLPLAIWPFFYFTRKFRKYSRRNQVKMADISTVLQEVFSGIRVVKAFATEGAERGHFGLENLRLIKIMVKKMLLDECSSRVMELIGALGMGFVIWYGGFQVINGQSTPGTFFSFLAGLLLLYEPIKKINTANADIQGALAGAERVFEILDSPDLNVEQGGDVEFKEDFKILSFQDVTFTYKGCPKPALDKVSFTLHAGERLAIVGPSGGGKTTLVNLIPRFYEPESGAILLNDRPLGDYTLSSLRRSMGVVSQDTFLFNVSVTENIAYGQGSLDQEAIVAAARTAYADDFIRNLPEGYDTVLGERGVKISGGQKQRLTIARALLKNPPLLILDEATSALDSESESIVQKALDNLMLHRTSIVIAHRLATVLTADRILVMERGRIVDEGPHRVLLERCDLYRRLYEMQFHENGMAEAAESAESEESLDSETVGGAGDGGSKVC
ncbi:MAG: ATP-binding cassette domain-containing protein [Desulfovibrionaceae bacterium]|nr:ATP-binding cassette domain-containing protein [Desulfovibrionaceae bacterium]